MFDLLRQALAVLAIATGGADYVPPACQEDQTVAFDGGCITVDDACFTNGYWFPLDSPTCALDGHPRATYQLPPSGRGEWWGPTW